MIKLPEYLVTTPFTIYLALWSLVRFYIISRYIEIESNQLYIFSLYSLYILSNNQIAYLEYLYYLHFSRLTIYLS